MPKFITVKQYYGSYSGEGEVSINIDTIRCIYDIKGDRNKASIYFINDTPSVNVAPTRLELLKTIENA